MTTVATVAQLLEDFAPGSLAEDWDNVGLLVGDRSLPVRRLMTCLTMTPDAAAEAIDKQVDMVIAHHPIPFRPLNKLTTDSTTGQILWDLAAAKISLYSPHTAFDSASGGINQQLAEGLSLTNIKPLVATETDPAQGSGRYGVVKGDQTLNELGALVKGFLRLDSARVVGEGNAPLKRIAVACGSGGSFLASARLAGCDCLVTGETTFHTCLEAEAAGIALVLPGHYASERFAVESLADHLATQLPSVQVWPCQSERDPLRPI